MSCMILINVFLPPQKNCVDGVDLFILFLSRFLFLSTRYVNVLSSSVDDAARLVLCHTRVAARRVARGRQVNHRVSVEETSRRQLESASNNRLDRPVPHGVRPHLIEVVCCLSVVVSITARNSLI